MSHFLFTSESVGIGHPDKIADQISDAVLDACIEQDPSSKVACEAMVSTGLVFLGGEITSRAKVDYADVVRQTVQKIGYDRGEYGFDYRSLAVLQCINKQSPDIAIGVEEGRGRDKHLGAGDQGMMFGYACLDTPELIPLPIHLSQQIVRELDKVRRSGQLPYLRPDAKTQITVEYSRQYKPVRIHTVVLSTQHDDLVDFATIEKDMRILVKRIAPKGMIDDETLFYINPTGRFVWGGPGADCGLTGRKITVDTYGGMAHHGGGAFSGKDPTKVDRSASYAARYAAKNIVAAGIASRCEVQLSYAIGVSHPISLFVNTFGTGTVSEEKICKALPEVFDFSPKGIIQMLDLRRPIYQKTAWGGHFGREDEDFTWEQTNKTDTLQECLL